MIGVPGSGWWIGVVEDRIDPLKLGRCKVRIFGHQTENKENLATEDLHWAHPMYPLNDSNPYSPKEGDTVVGVFLDGEDSQFPLMMGVLPKIPAQEENAAFGFNDPRTAAQLRSAPVKPGVFGETAGRYPRVIDEPTTPRAARGESLNKSQFKQKQDKVIRGSPEAVRSPGTVYPYNKVYESESGHLFEFDDTPGQERINLYHRNGSYKEFYSTGDTVEKAEKNRSDIIRENCTVYVGKNLTFIVKGDVSYLVDGDFSVSCKNFNLSAKQKVGSSSGSTTSISAKSSAQISAGSSLAAQSKTTTSIQAGTSLSMESKGGDASLTAGTNCNISAKAKGSFSAKGALALSSSSVANLNGPLVKIGKGGGGGGGGGGSGGGGLPGGGVINGALDSSLLSSIAKTASESLSAVAGSFFSSVGGLANSLTEGLSSISGSDLFSSLSSTLSNGISFGDIAGFDFGNIKSFSDLAGKIGDLTDSFDFSNLADSLNGVLGDSLGSIFDSDSLNGFDGLLNSLGDKIQGLDGFQDILSSNDLFKQAKGLFEVGMEIKNVINNPISALSKLGGAADILGQFGGSGAGGGFIDKLVGNVEKVSSFLRQNNIADTFQDIANTLMNSNSVSSDLARIITPVFDDFVGEAKTAFLSKMPSGVQGLAAVMNRVEDGLLSNSSVKRTIIDIIQEGTSSRLTTAQIQSSVSDFLGQTFASAVQTELDASPITYFNLQQATMRRA